MKQFRDSRYWVSKDGEVWSKTDAYNVIESRTDILKSGKVKTYTWVKNRPEKWKELKPQPKRKGYLYVRIGYNQHTSIHRMVAEVYCPGYFEGAHVDHIDNDNTNNHYTNLQWCTKEYNHQKGDKINYPLYNVRHK